MQRFFLQHFFLPDAVWNRRTGQKSVILITRSPQRQTYRKNCKMTLRRKRLQTYKDSEFLYIVRGYGEQETGGYSICIRDLYLTSNAIIFDTELIGPRKGETISKSPSYPYIVVKVELRDENVVFE